MRPSAEQALRAAQPYNTGENLLSCLHELDIVDKHRLLITAISTMNKWGVDVSKTQTLWFDENRFIPLVQGYEVVNIPTSTYDRQRDQDFKLQIDVAFGKPEVVEGNLVLATVKKMTEYVDGLVSDFKPYLF